MKVRRDKTVIAGRTAIILTMLLLTSVIGAQHVIRFGGAIGSTYSPDELTVQVGDTVVWEGLFADHPLSSTTVPTGAASFHAETGNRYSYVPVVAGTYDYRCDFHFQQDMVGSFEVGPASSVRFRSGAGADERDRVHSRPPVDLTGRRIENIPRSSGAQSARQRRTLIH